MYHPLQYEASLSPIGQAAWAELEPLIRRVVREEHERAAAPKPAAPKPAASKATVQVLLSPESLSDHLRSLGLDIPARTLTEMMRSGQVPSISLGIETGARDLRRFYLGWMNSYDGLIDGARITGDFAAFRRLGIQLLSACEIARVLDVSKGHVRNLLSGGILGLLGERQPSGVIRYSGMDLSTWLLGQASGELSAWQHRGGDMAVFEVAGRS